MDEREKTILKIYKKLVELESDIQTLIGLIERLV